MYVGELHRYMRVKGHVYMRSSKTEKEKRYMWYFELRMKLGGLGLQKARWEGE